MSAPDPTSFTVHAVEALMLVHFRNEPFHNLPLIYQSRIRAAVPGGTCSDHALSFVSAGVRAGLDVSLHSGFIDERKIHRLARVQIGTHRYFADVGNGWPAIKLYPADAAISFRCFGMAFRTEIAGDRVRVFHDRLGKETLQMEIETHCEPDAQIRADIARRFSSGIVYPFSNSIRFSQIVGSRFLFLRGPRLEIYSENEFDCIEGIEEGEVPAVLLEHFGFDIRPFLHDLPPEI